jgi:mannose-1-phosphate guanylyltransferase / mannose-6-phosphate isomerase
MAGLATTDDILPVILCGGSGTRLWPASRDSYPKQFIPLIGERSSFQETLRRVHGADSPGFRRPLVIANHAVRFIAAEQALNENMTADIVLEPEGRDSAPALAVAALWAARSAPDTLVLVLAADHVIMDTQAFRAACHAAATHARKGLIMTLGMQPDRPATGYGYLQPGPALPGGDPQNPAYVLERFVEKPDAAKAADYIAQGYLWNSGNFLFRADVMIAELEHFAPAVLSAARAALDGATRDLDFIRLAPDAFRAAPKISIDYAVMEKTKKAGVLPARVGWSDIGEWDALWQISAHDEHGNAVRGRVELSNTRDSLIHSEHVLTSVVGLEGIVVVATPDAILVTSRAAAGQIKDLVAAMKARGVPEATDHLRVYAPWGWHQRMDLGERFKVKRIQVAPGGRLSLQKHFHRAEHWVVVRGTAEVTIDGTVTLLGENEAAYIPVGAVHRLANPGRIPLEIVEVQVGAYTGEDDIVRVEDVYGR